MARLVPRVLKRETIYQGRVIRLVREELQVAGQRFTRETIKHPGAVVIVPLRKDGQLVLVRQYRRAVERTLLELPAGTLEPGEPRLSCAKRELMEETGWRATQWERLGQFYAAPGFISEQMTVYLAQGLTQHQASPEPDEMVTPVYLTLSQAFARIRRGTICDAKTIIGILFAAARLQRRGEFATLVRSWRP
jgi:ADP-ribose pyrophosphatase